MGHRTSRTGADQPGARIAIVGGGAGGATVALRLAEQGLAVTLFEQGNSLVNGPPVCHLHAGGSLYRELSDDHCITLLEQSIETVKSYPHTVKVRPTVIAVPRRDGGDPAALLPRLERLKMHYRQRIAADPANRVLGDPADFYHLFDRQTLQALADQPLPRQPQTPSEWMIPLAHELDLDQLQYPLVLVQEYGVSLFRLAASVSLAIARLPHARLKLGTRVTGIRQSDTRRWELESVSGEEPPQTAQFDYLVNACGFRSGMLDDWAGFRRQRMVEFKAAYLAQWRTSAGVWPEVVFHGQRGTPHGMAQLTPYADGIFQLHGMTEEITLFKGGRVQSDAHSAQPQLPEPLLAKIEQGWPKAVIEQRTRQAIDHVAQFVPHFANASVAGPPLFGAQQIPGEDPALRTSAASFDGHRYARIEIVKLSSALTAADAILADLSRLALWSGDPAALEGALTTPAALERAQVIRCAEALASGRDYPCALAR